MFEIKGANAIITGSAIGIGKSYAKHLLKNGANVCISDINEVNGAETLDEFQKEFGKDRVIFQKCDVSNREEILALYSSAETKLGYISIFVNNAGLAHEDIGKSLDVMLYGVGVGTAIAMDKMSFKNGGKGGRIVSTASYAGLVSLPHQPPRGFGYTMAKWGVVGMTRSFKTAEPESYKSMGIKAMAICPWYVDTQLVRDALNVAQLEEKYNQKLLTEDELGEVIIKVLNVDKNGSVWGVYPGMPLLEMPNTHRSIQAAHMLVAKLSHMVGYEWTTMSPYCTIPIVLILLYISLRFLFCFLDVLF